MTDFDFDKGQHRSGRSDKPIIHDWRLRHDAAEAVAAEIKWPQLLAFDSVVRERLAAVLVRREAERAAERGLSSDVRARLWRARLESRRQEFADALELEVCQPFGLDDISYPPGPPEWWLKEQDSSRLCRPRDVEAGFDPYTATWLRNAIGPAMVVTQPDFEIHGAARSFGGAALVAWTRGVSMIEAPSQLCWAGPRRNLVMWVPDRCVTLDD